MNSGKDDQIVYMTAWKNRRSMDIAPTDALNDKIKQRPLLTRPEQFQGVPLPRFWQDVECNLNKN